MTKKLTLKIGTLLLAVSSHISALATDPLDLIRLDYEYYDDDIQAVWDNRLNQNTYTSAGIIAGLPQGTGGGVRLEDITQANTSNVFANAINNLRNNARTTYLLPVNTGGHWVVLALKRNNDDSITPIYIDSAGALLSSHQGNEVQTALTAGGTAADAPIANLGNDLIDASFRQQTGPSCGAFTAENAIVLTQNDLFGLTAAQVRALIAANVGGDEAVRKTHFLNLYGDADTNDVTTLKPRSEVAANRFSSQNRTLTNGINNVNKLVNDRLVSANNFSAVAAGDNGPEFGVWVKGIMGVGSDEDGTNSTNSQNSSSSKSSFKGVVIGADAEIMDGTTLGLAFSRIEAKSKYKLLYIDTNQDKITNTIYSLYGSSYITDDIMINASVAAGKIKVKSEDYLLSGDEIKQSGNLLSGSLTTNYKLYSDDMMSATPRVGANFNHVDLGGYQRNSIKVPGNKQDSVDVGVGTDVSFMHIQNNVKLIPKFSVDYNRIVWSKGNDLNITNLNNETVVNKKVVVDKNILKLGAGFIVEPTNNIEISTGYEYTSQGKSVNHLGYAKFRFNF